MKKEIVFIAIGVSLLLAVAGFFVYSINFLIKNINVALNPDLSKNQEIVRFDLEGLKKLGIIK
jgi:hypothetical protein